MQAEVRRSPRWEACREAEMLLEPAGNPEREDCEEDWGGVLEMF